MSGNAEGDGNSKMRKRDGKREQGLQKDIKENTGHYFDSIPMVTDTNLSME